MEVKGAVVRSIKEYVKSNHEERYDEWITSLSADAKEIFSNPINVTEFYSVEKGLIEPSEKVSSLFFQNIEEGAWHLGNYSAEIALTGIYKAFVLIATPSFVISRSASMLKTLYANSELIITDKSSNSVTAEIKKLPKNDIVLEQRIAGWMDKILEITGCKNISIDIPLRLSKNQEVTRYNITWD